MRYLFAVFLAAILSGCGSEYEAKKALKGLLTDPSSVQFSDLRQGAEPGNVCGFFNAKNRLGGYVGKTAFFYENSTTEVGIVTGVKDSEFQRLWDRIQLSRSFEDEYIDLSLRCDLIDQWGSVCGEKFYGPSSDFCPAFKLKGGGLYQVLKERFDKN